MLRCPRATPVRTSGAGSMTSTPLIRTTKKWVRHFVVARMPHRPVHAASEVVLLGAAVFGNVVSAATSARLGGIVDLVISNTSPYRPHVSSAAPFTIPSTPQPKRKTPSLLLAPVCICSKMPTTGSVAGMALLLSARSTLPGSIQTQGEGSLRSHSSTNCTSGRLMVAKGRKHPSSYPTSSSLSSTLTMAATVTARR